MILQGWKYYNHALIPTTQPHEEANLKELKKTNIWKTKDIFLVRYTTEYDCGYETEWWYCIKDEPFNLSQVNAKKRYEVNRGLRNIEIKRINAYQYSEQIINVAEKAYAEYPKKYRPIIIRENWIKNLCDNEKNENTDYWGMFDKTTSQLCGYSKCIMQGSFVDLAMVKIDPAYLKTGVNAAFVYIIIQEYINSGRFQYICDGERNLLHETNYQDFLIRYLGFRKAYCRLNIEYRPFVGVIIKVLFPFKKFIKRFDSWSMIHNINALLKMECIKRSY
jgi:hypothetical protein